MRICNHSGWAHFLGQLSRMGLHCQFQRQSIVDHLHYQYTCSCQQDVQPLSLHLTHTSKGGRFYTDNFWYIKYIVCTTHVTKYYRLRYTFNDIVLFQLSGPFCISNPQAYCAPFFLSLLWSVHQCWHNRSFYVRTRPSHFSRISLLVSLLQFTMLLVILFLKSVGRWFQMLTT